MPFDVSCSALGKYSIPHSLLLYSVHVKWISICVQDVHKDTKKKKKNTLDDIICTHLCCVLLLGQNATSFVDECIGLKVGSHSSAQLRSDM